LLSRCGLGRLSVNRQAEESSDLKRQDMGSSKRTGAAAMALTRGSAKVGNATPKSTSGSSSPGGTEQRSCLTSQLRKTKICLYHLKGACQYGANCAFAHSCTELQSTPDLRKTRLCQAFEAGACNNPDCSFAHGEEELRSTNLFYKKTLCIWNQKGKCRNGDQCRFAHGPAELRTNPSSTQAQNPRRAAKAANSNAAAKPQEQQSPKVAQWAPAEPVKACAGSTTELLKEPMKVLPASCLASQAELAQQLAAPALPLLPDSLSPASLDSWWQWSLGYGLQAPPLLPGAAQAAPRAGIDDLKADLERLRRSVECQDVTSDLERMREDVQLLTQKCSQIQMQIQAADSNLSGIFFKSAPGFEADNIGAGVETQLPNFWA